MTASAGRTFILLTALSMLGCATSARVPAGLPGQAPLEVKAGSLFTPTGQTSAHWSSYVNARRGNVGYETRYSLAGAPGTVLPSSQTSLSWTPASASFAVRWEDTAPGAARDCALTARAQYDLTGAGGATGPPASLYVLGGHCDSGHDVPGAFMDGWRHQGAGLQWSALAGTLTRLQIDELRPDAAPGASAHALNLAHHGQAGRWQGDAQLVFRDLTGSGADPLPEWSALAHVRRRLTPALSLVAGWERAPGTIPVPNAPAEVVSLGMDVLRPLRHPGGRPKELRAGATWKQAQAPESAGHGTTSEVNLHLSLAW